MNGHQRDQVLHKLFKAGGKGCELAARFGVRNAYRPHKICFLGFRIVDSLLHRLGDAGNLGPNAIRVHAAQLVPLGRCSKGSPEPCQFDSTFIRIRIGQSGNQLQMDCIFVAETGVTAIKIDLPILDQVIVELIDERAGGTLPPAPVDEVLIVDDEMDLLGGVQPFEDDVAAREHRNATVLLVEGQSVSDRSLSRSRGLIRAVGSALHVELAKPGGGDVLPRVVTRHGDYRVFLSLELHRNRPVVVFRGHLQIAPSAIIERRNGNGGLADLVPGFCLGRAYDVQGRVLVLEELQIVIGLSPG